ncbi:MAG: glycosyltransferase family 4 protein [Maritimibacter sp.]|nr:glycosyltransferase family 4 protein [Maritimibacter sp.]
MADPGPAPARLLDLTRLVSRVDRGPWTGIDRVEAAWLARLLGDETEPFGLVRRSGGFFLFDRAGMAALRARLTGAVPWGAPDWRARLRLRARPAMRAVEGDLRRLALARAAKPGLARMLGRHLPAGTCWFNLGHSNLDDGVFAAVRAAGGRSIVMVHDMIPLDWPDFQRPGTVERFADKMQAVAVGADLVICPSEAAAADVRRHFAPVRRVPEIAVAPLGVAPAMPDRRALPEAVDPARPYFVVVGTIEPRKNHALLLDIWDDFAEYLAPGDVPALHIAGARGWANEDVFARLDNAPVMRRHVFEHNGLGDGAVSALVSGARALLMPSHAEGFGLPPAEALALGTPAIVGDLPVYREVLGNNPVYLNTHDMYSWANEILEFARGRNRGPTAASGGVPELPTWQAHFDLVFKAL